MIDIGLFKSILDTEDKGYIENGDYIPFNIIELFSHYKADKVKKLFVGNPDKHTINKFSCELKCKRCGNLFVKVLSKNAFLDYLKGKGLVLCDDCKNEKIEEDKKKRAEDEILFHKMKEDGTQTYINNFLDPEKSWKKGVKTYQKINDISRAIVDWDVIKDYIKSMDYYDFLLTPYWKAISEKVRKNAGFKCQICNSSENLNVHHRTYYNHGDEIHHMEDLTCICDNCHEKYHFD